MNKLSRTQALIGENGLKKLQSCHVLIVGLGGVGGYVYEMLLRTGIGAFTLVDGDCFDVTNLNRQVLATLDSLGKFKTETAKKRAGLVGSDAKIQLFPIRYNALSKHEILNSCYDYCCDCIDSVADKVDLILTCNEKKIPIISAMGAGNRISPQFAVTDLFKTQNDGLARAVRHRLKGSAVTSLKTVCDKSVPLTVEGVTGSISYAPALMGCLIANEVVKELLCC